MAIKKPKSKHASAMLIDDNEIDNFINLKMLEGCNFAERVYVHTNGKSALDFFKNIERIGEKDFDLLPQIIFLDLNMPVMDGFQFAEEFEKMDTIIKTKSKIIILTTSLNPSDIEKAKNYPQIIQFVNKPLSQNTLDSI